ncbi:MAG TPA: asparagine synthase-related protein [Thermoanaerobaculia bacterium]|nr:asparagine synthase-related protein [Thermoanaerobaculia bacterium]
MKPYLAIFRDDGTCELRAGRVARIGTASLIGEVRLDDRFTLARKLGVHDADDRELLLHAWRRWRTECVQHLLGDFSFALHDGETHEAFVARDRFGIRPCYLARIDDALLVSNSLEAILARREVDADTLDDRAVADYLDSGIPSDAEATIYAHVKRLAPAHVLSQGRVRRYWSLNWNRNNQRRRAESPPLQEFEAALQHAIADRTTTSSAIVFMSGGLDSTTLAALAHERDPHARILAATSVYRTRAGDVEESFAAEAARSIGIPIRFFALDQWSPLHSLESGEWTAEPGPLLTRSMTRAIYSAVAEHAPVAMHGHPADAVLSADLQLAMRPLIDARRFGAIATALMRYARIKRRVPWFFLRELFASSPPHAHPLQSAMWSSLFEWAHPLQTGAPIELVYPWADLRVIDAALALDPFPWLIDKHVLRELLRNRVSESIRTRPKTFFRGDPWRVALTPEQPVDIDAASPYIDVAAFIKAVRESKELNEKSLRVVALAYWLRERPHALEHLRG